jgi:enoyl-[acyl-carrier protein] reductase/trans-2-enoyl-CoA reductase (NAD+)
MVVAPKIRGFICTTAHPEGLAKHVAEQIVVVKNRGPIANGPKKVLVIGASTGYGLASRIAAAFGSNAGERVTPAPHSKSPQARSGRY